MPRYNRVVKYGGDRPAARARSHWEREPGARAGRWHRRLKGPKANVKPLPTPLLLSALAAIMLFGIACRGSSSGEVRAVVDAGGMVREVTVGPEWVDCVGVGPRQCMVVDGSLFYDAIDGFDYEEGYRYRLRIEQYDAWPGQEEPPADAGRYGYRLIELISKTPAS